MMPYLGLPVVAAAFLIGIWGPYVQGKKLFDVHWNTTNAIFRIDNTDHIIDVNKGNNPFEYDQVNIICPVYSPGTKEEDMERYIIYNVSKEEYDSCRITNSNPRIIAVCDKPHQVMYFTITFRSFTPQPGGLEFRPGQDYYFISTSSGGLKGLHQRIGGRCTTHNMKVIFKVCCDPSRVPSGSSAGKNTGSSASSTPSAAASLPSATRQPVSKLAQSTSTVSPVTSSTQDKGYVFENVPALPPTTNNNNNQRSPSINNNNNNNQGRPRPGIGGGSSTTPVPPYWLRPYPATFRPPYKTYEVPSDEKKSSKKTEDRDKLPNETRAKNEELVKNCSSRDKALPAGVGVWVLTCAVMAATMVSAMGR